MLGKKVSLIDNRTEHKFKNLAYKITRFAMDFVRKEVMYGKTKQNELFNSKKPDYCGDIICECSCKTQYKLPCYHILYRYDVIPLDVVNFRWWIGYGKYQY